MNGSKKTNIGIFGSSGKMGQEIIEEMKSFSNLNLFYDYSRTNRNNLEELCKSDVIIDFSLPDGTMELIKEAKKHKTKILCGTTGFSKEQFEEIKLSAKSIPILYSANMSIGINLIKNLVEFFNKNLPSDFSVDIIDMHHKNKKDKPSGTSLMLKESIESRDSNIVSIRAGKIFGTHEIYFNGDDEQIMIRHQASSRKIFAQGALKAALFLSKCQEPKLYGMDDMLI